MMLIKQNMNVLQDLVARKGKSNQHSFCPFLLFFWKTTSPFANPLFYFMVMTLSSSSFVVPETKFNRRQKAVVIHKSAIWISLNYSYRKTRG